MQEVVSGRRHEPQTVVQFHPPLPFFGRHMEDRNWSDCIDTRVGIDGMDSVLKGLCNLIQIGQYESALNIILLLCKIPEFNLSIKRRALAKSPCNLGIIVDDNYIDVQFFRRDKDLDRYIEGSIGSIRDIESDMKIEVRCNDCEEAATFTMTRDKLIQFVNTTEGNMIV